MIEPTNGTIIIDNVDIRLIGLHDLRSKITIIPQVNFSLLFAQLNELSIGCDYFCWYCTV
jgi:ABC-type multidrug transport system fused ATPase/permease subunit